MTVTESFGVQRWVLVNDEATELTTTSSSVSSQAVLWVVPLLFGESPLYEATQ